jgi:signal transduction histidine kinase/NO-binding membrane sensor protein with MHYT domain/DNA-binding response OmpR family regulator/HPt (histidine-containing phosphotransfer) domain-containing protein
VLATTYNTSLVIISILVAVLASYTALNLVERVASLSGKARDRWVIGGACAMGAGIWSMHFIGMLAFELPIEVGYDPAITSFSLLLAVLVSGLALRQASRPELPILKLASSAILMGIGISSMHYTGMASLRVIPGIVYAPLLVAASVLIAIAASGAALWIAFRLRHRAPRIWRYRLLAACVMGSAIVGMHYTGMSAAAFPAGSFCVSAAEGIGPGMLAFEVITGTVAILGAALITIMIDVKREANARTMEVLRSSAEERDALLRNLPGVVYRCRNDATWTMEYLSDGILELTGHPPDAFFGEGRIDYASLIHDEDRDLVFNAVQEGIANRSPFEVVYRLVTVREEVKWVWEHGHARFDDQGKLLSLQGYVVDITRQKQSEDARKSALAALTATLESTAEGILVIGLKQRISAMNKRFIDQMQLPEDVAGSRDFQKVMDHMLSIVADPVAFQKSTNELLDHPEKEFRGVMTLRDGRLIQCYCRPKYIGDRNTGTVISYRDITEQVADKQRLLRAKEAAESATRAKSDFLAKMSHEIRTPMNGVLGAAQLALEREDDVKQREYLELILSSGRHLLHIIDDILDVTKIEAGRMSLETISFNLHEMIGEVRAHASGQASLKNIDLEVTIAPEVPSLLRGDPFRLTQVLLNLLNNAVKFTDSGTVSLRLSAQEGKAPATIRFEVADSGIGLSEAQIGELFKPFHQADSSMTRKYGGSGLGLAICKHLVEQMGGSIEVASVPGLGSRFWFVLSFSERDGDWSLPDKSMQETPVAALKRPDFGGKTVLVVDDCPINQTIASEFLEAAGAAVLLAADGQEALVTLQGRDPGSVACVLMDLQMPVMNGIDATVRIRGDARLAGLPVIAMTANARFEDREQCRTAGMDDFMSKPIMADRFYGTLSRYLLDIEVVETAHAADLAYDGHSPPATHTHSAGASRQPGLPLTGRTFDLRNLSDMLRADPVKLRHFTFRFIDTAQQNVDDIQQALTQSDWDALAKLGHRSKSSARSIGAFAFASQCEALETMPASQPTQQAEMIAATLQSMLDDIRQEAEQLFSLLPDCQPSQR